MNIEVARNAIGPLDLILSEAKEALSQVQGDVFNNISYPRAGGSYDNPDAAMATYLEEIYETLLVVLEGAELPEARASLAKKWPEFLTAKKGLRYTHNDAEYEHSSSPALDHLERVVGGLRMTVSGKLSTVEAWTLNRLEIMLRNTAALVRQRKVIPKSEVDIRNVMHDYLKACFTGFRRVDLGMALDMAEHGMADGRLAELARHRHVLRVIEMLSAKEDDLPLQEGIAHLLQLVRRQAARGDPRRGSPRRYEG